MTTTNFPIKFELTQEQIVLTILILQKENPKLDLLCFKTKADVKAVVKQFLARSGMAPLWANDNHKLLVKKQDVISVLRGLI